MIRLQVKRHNFGQYESFWRLGRHPKDVPFVSEFWRRTYGLGAISPRKLHISAQFKISNLQNYKFQRRSPARGCI